jgi:ribosomal protein S18 acetylase RimI-like enzyme
MTDTDLVDGIFDRLTAYSILAEGVAKVPNAAVQFLTELPRGCQPQSKHAFAVMKDGEAVGLADFVVGYPDRSTVFIGLLAIVESQQHQGIGSGAERLVEEFARRFGAAKLRLAVVEGNAIGRAFWQKAGFHETGERRQYAGAARTITVRLMEKPLKTG